MIHDLLLISLLNISSETNDIYKVERLREKVRQRERETELFGECFSTLNPLMDATLHCWHPTFKT